MSFMFLSQLCQLFQLRLVYHSSTIFVWLYDRVFILPKQSQKSRSGESRFLGLFRKGITGIMAKFHRTEVVICIHSECNHYTTCLLSRWPVGLQRGKGLQPGEEGLPEYKLKPGNHIVPSLILPPSPSLLLHLSFLYPVKVPQELDTCLRGSGLQPGEVELPEHKPKPGNYFLLPYSSPPSTPTLMSLMRGKPHLIAKYKWYMHKQVKHKAFSLTWHLKYSGNSFNFMKF